jgi:hypothetical protein
MRSSLLALAAVATAPILTADAAHAAPAKPLVQGTFEVARMHMPDGKDLDIAQALEQGTTVWARMAFTFDGAKVTVSSAMLDHDDGRWSACEVTVSTVVTWSRSGFTVAADVEASGRFTTFKKLTATDDDNHEDHCSINLQKGTYGVVAGAAPQIKKDGGTIFLSPTTETDKIDWSKHVR